MQASERSRLHKDIDFYSLLFACRLLFWRGLIFYGVYLMGAQHTVNSIITRDFFHKFVDEIYEKNKYVTFSWRIGADRSLSQNSLLHVWLTEYAAFILNVDKKSIEGAHLNGIKRRSKKQFYNETGHAWMLSEVYDFSNGSMSKVFASSKDYKTPEMFEFLTWLQHVALHDGCVLESKGEFNKLQRSQTE